jgi:hypothetical protein
LLDRKYWGLISVVYKVMDLTSINSENIENEIFKKFDLLSDKARKGTV